MTNQKQNIKDIDLSMYKYKAEKIRLLNSMEFTKNQIAKKLNCSYQEVYNTLARPVKFPKTTDLNEEQEEQEQE